MLDPRWAVPEAADLLWSITHPRAWDDLIGHCGWNPDHLVEVQIEIARRTLLR